MLVIGGGSPNWKDKTIWTRDNLDVMQSMNSASVDLIYLDPPFNSNSNYAAPIGSQAAGAEFKDTWGLDDLKISWWAGIKTVNKGLYHVIEAAGRVSGKSSMSYLIYMSVRLLEMHRILKPTGSIYLHCDPTMSHYLKLVMDAIFGRKQFRNELIWHYYNGTSNIKRAFVRKHDVVLFYGSDAARTTFIEDEAREPYVKNSNFVRNPKAYKSKYRPNPLGKRMHDVWRIPTINNMAKERVGYPTQKPIALLERIIKASSNENDMVFDPFCGCATTLVVADRLKRQWVGIDISPLAVKLVEERIKTDQGALFEEIHPREDVPQRTDLGKLRPYDHPENKRKLYGEQAGNCGGCGEHFHIHNMEIDHKTPRSKGGTDHIDNLMLLCGYCNRVKGNRTMEYLRASLRNSNLMRVAAG